MFDVVYCCNDLYAPYVGVSMLSFLENNCNDFDEITIHIVGDNISDNYKNKLNQIIDRYTNASIMFYEFNLADYNCEPKREYNHPIAFSFLFLSSILNVDKVMYLDADSVISGSYKELIDNTDIDNKFGASVLDVYRPYHKKNLGIEGRDYYNTGFVWLNLDFIRKNNLEQKFLDIVNTRAYLPFCDQDTMGMVVNDKDIIKVHPKYNFVGYFLEFSYEDVLKIFSLKPQDYYPKNEVEEAKNSPVFNHFINFFVGAPWNDTSNPMYDLYMKYADMTPFEYDDIFQEKKLSLWRRVFFGIGKLLPNFLLVKIASFYLKHVLDEPNLKEK